MASPLLTTFTALRLSVGVLSWVAPGTSARVFLLSPTTSGSVTRLFGARDAALALAIQDRHPDVRRRALQVGVAVDTVDVIGTIIEFARGGMSRPAAVLGGGGAALFAALGLAALGSRPSD